MATKIKIIRSVDYLDISDNGTINFAESKKNLARIAREEDETADFDILMDFRRTQWILSTDEIYYLVEAFLEDPETYQDRVALLLLPGVNFDSEHFKELCSRNKRMAIRTFTNYEDAIQWFYYSE
jgi:hypothetical protein